MSILKSGFHKLKPLLLLALTSILLTGCQCTYSVSGSPYRVQPWRQTELFFGLNTPDGTPISTNQWQAFLDQYITPRFTDGLTVLPAEGRWLDTNHVTQAENSRVVIILYPAAKSADADRNIQTIASEYIREFHQESVLRSDTKTSVTFYTNATNTTTRSAP